MNSQQNPNYTLFILPEANPIQKKGITPPRSLYSLASLPNFSYSKENYELSPSQPSDTQIFKLQSQQLSQLFQNPIYVSHQCFLQQKNSNQLGILKVKPTQSGMHPPISSKKSENICFESRFESGNLALVAKPEKDGKQYFMMVHKDTNTSRCTQWFFFKVSNVSFTGCVTFHILNFTKGYSAFENGMKIALCSQRNNYEWGRGCSNIQYRKTNIKQGYHNYYCLSFTYNFQYQNDQTYFAYSYPYTFSMLDKLLLNICNESSSFIKRKTVGESLGGNPIDMLSITNPSIKKIKKKIIYIVGRVHPGQTPSSFVMEGLIKFLSSKNLQAQSLRDHFIFKLIPMLNPDGVINGNYRCSLSGNDLNRIWNYPSKDTHPQIYYVKKHISQDECFLFIDLHAHSKKKGIFMYGCNDPNNPYISRHIPFLLWKQIPSFNYYQCNFNTNQQKKGTARLAIWTQFGLKYSYTMECSFCSPVQFKNHFIVQDYIEIGSRLAYTFYRYFCKRDLREIKEIFIELEASSQLLQYCNDQSASQSDNQLESVSQIKIQKNNKPQKIQKMNKSIKKPNTQPLRFKIQKSIQFQKIQQKHFIQRKARYKQPLSNQLQPDSRVKICFRENSVILPTLQETDKNQCKITEIRSLSFSQSPQKTCQTQKNNCLSPSNQHSKYNINKIDELSSLFLPSVTKISYKPCKRYGQSKIPQTTFTCSIPFQLKQQIKSIEKKPPSWRKRIESIL